MSRIVPAIGHTHNTFTFWYFYLSAPLMLHQCPDRLFCNIWQYLVTKCITLFHRSKGKAPSTINELVRNLPSLPHTHLLLCGNVEVALTEIKEKVLVDLLSHGVARGLTVQVRRIGQVHLDRKQNHVTIRQSYCPYPASLRSRERNIASSREKA